MIVLPGIDRVRAYRDLSFGIHHFRHVLRNTTSRTAARHSTSRSSRNGARPGGIYFGNSVHPEPQREHPNSRCDHQAMPHWGSSTHQTIFPGISVMKASLRGLFKSYGEVLDVVAHKNLRMRGQAFVSFATIDIAKKAAKEVRGFPLYSKPMVWFHVECFPF